MSISATGVVIMILGIYGLIFNAKFLYNILIFFIPFSATAVINVGSGDTGSAIQPFMFLGMLWLISIFAKNYRNFLNATEINKKEFTAILLLLGFAITSCLSLIMPFLINGKEMGNVNGNLNSSNPIIFSLRNVSQYIYLLFGIIMAISLYFHNRTEDNYKNTIKIYSYSILFVVVWGFFELLCNYTNISYPSFIFNNSISQAAQSSGMFLETEEQTKRIISVAVESSVLVQSVEILLPFLIIGIIKDKYIFNSTMDVLFVLILIVFIIRSTSTLGIVCLGFIGIWTMFYYLNKLSPNRKILFITGLVFIMPFILLIIYYLFRGILDAALFNKSDTYSSLERASGIMDAWHTFLNHPILGAGWGSVSSFDLFVKLLSNTGIIGGVFFIIFLFYLIRNQTRAKNTTYNNSVFKTAIIISFCTLIFSDIISGFSFVFGFFWLTIGLILVTGTNFHKEYEVINDKR
ncbi:MAG: O-Antigen ligase [Mucilaginibacter sp.]|nr:O-Antigen ligase [Mucilaginibacter sp.]